MFTRGVVVLAHGDDGEHVAPISVANVLTRSAVVWWLAALLVVVAALYVAGVMKLRRRGDAWSGWRTASFLGPGLGVMAFASMGGPGYYDDTVFSVHMIQHMMLMMVTLLIYLAGSPVRGSRLCEYRVPPISKYCS